MNEVQTLLCQRQYSYLVYNSSKEHTVKLHSQNRRFKFIRTGLHSDVCTITKAIFDGWRNKFVLGGVSPSKSPWGAKKGHEKLG